MIDSTVGDRIVKIRGGKSQEIFAKELREQKSTLGAYERGERKPNAAFLRKLAERGININWLLTGEGPEKLPGIIPDHEKVSPLEVNDAGVRYGAGLNVDALRQIIEELERQLELEKEKPEPLEMTPYKKALAISMLYQRYASHESGANIAAIEGGVRDLLTLLH